MRSPDDCKVCIDFSDDVVCRYCYEAARERLKVVEDTLRLAQKWLGRVEWGEGANEMLRTISMVAAVLDKSHPWAKPGEP